MALTGNTDIILNLARGNGVLAFHCALANGTLTAGAAGCGYFSNSLNPATVGTTLPGTIQSLLQAGVNGNVNVNFFSGGAGTVDEFSLCWIYQVGTVNLAATGDQFTHSGTFTRLQRTIGGSTTNISYLAYIYITTATTVAAPVFTISTGGATAGYADQDGNAHTGTVTHTMPSATTAVQGLYNLMPNAGDTAFTDITQINVSAAGGAGAGTIYAVEPLCPNFGIGGYLGHADQVFGGIAPGYLNPATPDAGSVTSALVVMGDNNLAAIVGGMVVCGAKTS